MIIIATFSHFDGHMRVIKILGTTKTRWWQLKHFLFTSLPREMIRAFFSNGWFNHQLENIDLKSQESALGLHFLIQKTPAEVTWFGWNMEHKLEDVRPIE